ncbi:hypothetical protein L6452_32337 [Arctium lappa]|uniref:Uncharacterized protein n=1 Tax=Arctium lappa TaxID=4217 RepID=A0ACB8Z5E5_ARCLA|nr:hypothetical protein L6452_32337 [Arctium lappa]
MVSIGPLHRGDVNMQEFEMQKEIYLHDYLLRGLGSPPEQTLKACVEIVNSSISRIKTCYAELKTYTDIQLATMMVIDCCFILEFLHKMPSLEQLFVLCITVDLMLLENQIPFFVLQDIFESTRSESIQSTFLIGKLLELRKYIDPFRGDISNNNVGTFTTHDHILGLLHKSYNLASESEDLVTFQESPTPHTAIELHRAGVNFKLNQDENWLMAMKYEPSLFLCFYRPWGKPTLRMPKLYIEDSTERVLRNFIAYEQSPLTQVHHYFTSYATAMDMLVDVQEDIEKLVESEVVDNDLGSNEEAAKMINDICKEVCVIEFFYCQQWEELDSYYKGYWPKNIAWLRRTYFNSPWNIIALLAGIILFALTVVQTVFTIKAT